MNTPTVFSPFALLFFVNVFPRDGDESVKRGRRRLRCFSTIT